MNAGHTRQALGGGMGSGAPRTSADIHQGRCRVRHEKGWSPVSVTQPNPWTQTPHVGGARPP